MGHRVSAILVSLMPRTSMICGVIMGVHGFGDSCYGLHWFKVWGISGTDEEALDELSPGERIEVLSDDVVALSDVSSLAGRLGFRVISSEKTEEQVSIVLERSS